MDHTVAQAIRSATAKILRRLDVIIDALGKPPVQDIEGTPAPRKPLKKSATDMQDEKSRSPSPQELSQPNILAKKRGRPPKKTSNLVALPTTGSTYKTESSPPMTIQDNAQVFRPFFSAFIMV